ncbi:uncharacterized protein DS421_1g21010 [Arachis hypogaea]|nr:uncharacterized protein DS421_1g21010 [Arachis hypogaea]
MLAKENENLQSLIADSIENKNLYEYIHSCIYKHYCCNVVHNNVCLEIFHVSEAKQSKPGKLS